MLKKLITIKKFKNTKNTILIVFCRILPVLWTAVCPIPLVQQNKKEFVDFFSFLQKIYFTLSISIYLRTHKTKTLLTNVFLNCLILKFIWKIKAIFCFFYIDYFYVYSKVIYLSKRGSVARYSNRFISRIIYIRFASVHRSQSQSSSE